MTKQLLVLSGDAAKLLQSKIADWSSEFELICIEPEKISSATAETSRPENQTDIIEYISNKEIKTPVLVVHHINSAFASSYVEQPLSDVSKQFELVYFSTLNWIRQLLPSLRKNGGRFIMIGSIWKHLSLPKYAAFCASHAALHSQLTCLRRELDVEDVQLVNILSEFPIENVNPPPKSKLNLFEIDEKWNQRVLLMVDHVIRTKSPKPEYLLSRRDWMSWWKLKTFPVEWWDKILFNNT